MLRRGFSFGRLQRWNRPVFMQILLQSDTIHPRGKQSACQRLVVRTTIESGRGQTRHEQPNHRQQRADRSQDEPIHLRCRRRTAATEIVSRAFAAVATPTAADGSTARARPQGSSPRPMSPFWASAARFLHKRVAFAGGSGDNAACSQSPTSRSGSLDGF